MSETKNLRLFKHNEPLETNENKFDIDLALNQNWDKIEEFAGMVNDKVIELEDKDEEQDFNLQELQNEIKKDRENMINLEVEGQSIHIEDSSDLEGKLEVLGNVEQDVREGKNLYNAGKTIDDYFVTSGAKGNVITQYKAKDYVICKIDKGVMTIEKYNNSGYNWITKWIEIEKNTEYTISLDKSLTSVSVLGFSTKENKTEGVIIAELNASKKEVNFNSGDYAFYAVSFYPKQGLEIAIQVEEGKQKTEFEPYGASPSPEYPSEIRAVGDNINLLENKAKMQTIIDGIEFTINEDGIVKLNGIAAKDTTINLTNYSNILDLIKANHTVTFSTWIDNIENGTIYVRAGTSETQTVVNLGLTKQTKHVTQTRKFETNSNSILLRVQSGTKFNNSTLKIKIEKGTVPTSYSEFGQGSVEIKKKNKNLLKNTAKTQTVNGVTFTVNEDGSVMANGTAEAEASLTINNQINLEKGEYCISGCPKGGGNNTYRIGLWNNTWESIALDFGDSSIFTLQEDSKAIKCAINIKQGTTVKNIVFKPQIEKGTKATEYVEHQEETKILPIQKPMLEGDYFIKEIDGWKEVHEWDCYKFTGDENFVGKGTYNEFNVFAITQNLPFEYKLHEYEKGGICNVFKTGKSISYVSNSNIQEGIQLYYNPSNVLRAFYLATKEFKTVEELKAKIKEIDFKFYYKKQTPTKIPCTPEQAKILDELDNFQTYKPVTNITTDSIAKLKLKYIADTKTYIDNKTSNLEQQVSVINQLLSTTKTSSILLDNLQKDIESEVL